MLILRSDGLEWYHSAPHASTASNVGCWHLTYVSRRANDVSLSLQSGHHGCADNHPMPACRSVAVTLAPTLDSAFTVSLIAATGRGEAAIGCRRRAVETG